MHFEFHVEDLSTKNFIEIILPRMMATQNFNYSCRVHSYQGRGELPKKSSKSKKFNRHLLLDSFPGVLYAFSKLSAQGNDYCLIFICDLDQNNRKEFMKPIETIRSQYPQEVRNLFFLAIQELEAWLLGDLPTIRKRYPKTVKIKNLKKYDAKNEASDGTWEFLADAIDPRGSEGLKKKGYPFIGERKSEWVEKLAPKLDIDNNQSPSFIEFRNGLLEVCESFKTQGGSK